MYRKEITSRKVGWKGENKLGEGNLPNHCLPSTFQNIQIF
jgi:hypothetical protein